MTPHIEKYIGELPGVGKIFRHSGAGDLVQRGEVGARAEILARAREKHDADVRILGRFGQDATDLGNHLAVERVAFLRAIQRDVRDRAVDGVDDFVESSH